MQLELDAGNTRIKWRLKDASGLIAAAGRDLNREMGNYPELLNESLSVFLSSVEPKQTQWVQKHFPQVSIATTQAETLGLKNSYTDPNRMGIDRWLAMLAAYRSDESIKHLIVDAGTAVTLDVVEQGYHRGGFICPGLTMMKKAVLGETQTVYAQAEWLKGRALGTETQACLDHGMIDMVCSWIESHAKGQLATKVWLTGGDAGTLAPLLDVSVALEPDLVLNGLTEYFNQ